MAHMRGGIRTVRPERQERTGESRDSRNPALDWRDERVERTHRNVGDKERVISGLIGGGLLLHSLRASFSGINALGAVTGLALAYRALSGNCPAYTMLGVNRRDPADTSAIGRHKVHSDQALKIERSVMVQRPANDLYGFWRQLNNLPTIMSHVRSVEPLSERTSHWVIHTLPGAPTLEWDAEIINDIENERIGWITLAGATVKHAGSVQFNPLNSARHTLVTVTLQYDPPAGPIGAAIASLLGQDPSQKIADDLNRFKQAMESQATASR